MDGSPQFSTNYAPRDAWSTVSETEQDPLEFSDPDSYTTPGETTTFETVVAEVRDNSLALTTRYSTYPTGTGVTFLIRPSHSEPKESAVCHNNHIVPMSPIPEV